MTTLRRSPFAAALAVAQYGHRLADGLKTLGRMPHRPHIVLFPENRTRHAEAALLSRFAAVLRCSTSPADHEETLAKIRDALIAIDRQGELEYLERYDLAAVEPVGAPAANGSAVRL